MKLPVLSLLGIIPEWSPATAADNSATNPGRDDVTSLAAYNVKADRWEDLGFRVSWHLGYLASSAIAFVVSVTAAPNHFTEGNEENEESGVFLPLLR